MYTWCMPFRNAKVFREKSIGDGTEIEREGNKYERSENPLTFHYSFCIKETHVTSYTKKKKSSLIQNCHAFIILTRGDTRKTIYMVSIWLCTLKKKTLIYAEYLGPISQNLSSVTNYFCWL